MLLNYGLTTTTCSFNRTCLYLEIQENIYPLQVWLGLQMRYAFPKLQACTHLIQVKYLAEQHIKVTVDLQRPNFANFFSLFLI